MVSRIAERGLCMIALAHLFFNTDTHTLNFQCTEPNLGGKKNLFYILPDWRFKQLAKTAAALFH